MKITGLIIVVLLATGACVQLSPGNNPPDPDTAITPIQVQISPAPSFTPYLTITPQSSFPEPTKTPYVSITPRSYTPSSVITQTPRPTKPFFNREQITRFPPGQEVTIAFINMKDETTGWAVGFLHRPEASQTDSEDHILRTIDGGKTWFDVTPPELNAVPREYSYRLKVAPFFLDQNTAWAVFNNVDDTFNFRVWRTSDSGQTWKLSELVHEEQVWDLVIGWEFIDANQGWAMVGGGVATGSQPATFLHTNDGGAHWEIFFTGQGGPLYGGYKTGIHFLNDQIGLITRSSAYPHPSVLWTRDGGRTWEKQDVPPPENAPEIVVDYNCSASSPHLFSPSSASIFVWCLNTDGENTYYQKILYTTGDSGNNWQIHLSLQEVLDYLNTQVGFTLTDGLLNIPDTLQIDKILSLVLGHPVNQTYFVTEQTGWIINAIYDEYKDETTYSFSITSDGGITWQQLDPKIAAPDN